MSKTLAVFIMMSGAGNVMATEEAEYLLVLKEQNFELRSYEPHILAETKVDGDFEEAGSQAFGRLFKYISGDNKARQEVQMTSPVSQEAASEEISMTSPVGQQRERDQWLVSFMMPSSYTMDTIPEPTDLAVTLRQVPARHIAAVRYSGLWSEENYLSNKDALETWIEQQGLQVMGEPIWARYNPPFMPWFLRRNEILIPIANP
ncbi:MAG: effector-binding domain-containing protein [Oleispira sp.]|jgi:effector-binding domain-containing protein